MKSHCICLSVLHSTQHNILQVHPCCCRGQEPIPIHGSAHFLDFDYCTPIFVLSSVHWLLGLQALSNSSLICAGEEYVIDDIVFNQIMSGWLTSHDVNSQWCLMPTSITSIGVAKEWYYNSIISSSLNRWNISIESIPSSTMYLPNEIVHIGNIGKILDSLYFPILVSQWVVSLESCKGNQ